MPNAPDPDEAGRQQPDLQSIEVNLHALRDFALFVSDEVNANLHPYSDRIIAEHMRGVPFGSRTASAEVQAAATDYHGCLANSIEALRSYIAVSEAFIVAAETIAAAYGDADAISAARARDTHASLDHATTYQAAGFTSQPVR